MAVGDKKRSGVGQVLQSKAGNYYVKVDRDVTLKTGDVLLLEKPVDRFNGLKKHGAISEEKADALIERHTEGDLTFVKFFIKDPIVNS